MLRPHLAAAVLLAIAVAGCSSDEPEPEPQPASAPLAALDTDQLAVTRGEFCALVAPAAVEEALGGPPSTADGYVNGDTAEVAPGVTDVAHEYGCVWAGADGTAARAWVFAPPVTAGQAGRLRAGALRAAGCAPVPDAPTFGAHTAAVRCTGADGVATAYHGLFGDAWLSCSLSAPARDADLADRTDRWCASVVQAAG